MASNRDHAAACVALSERQRANAAWSCPVAVPDAITTYQWMAASTTCAGMAGSSGGGMEEALTPPRIRMASDRPCPYTYSAL
ncbi:hypothetical protein D9M68_519300 [compost metagenome]